jgi:hypothetical protein
MGMQLNTASRLPVLSSKPSVHEVPSQSLGTRTSNVLGPCSPASKRSTSVDRMRPVRFSGRSSTGAVGIESKRTDTRAGAPVRVAVPIALATATVSMGAVPLQVGPSAPQPETPAPSTMSEMSVSPERRPMAATVPVTANIFNEATAIRHPNGWRVPTGRGIP